jgi:hypothetical protein
MKQRIVLIITLSLFVHASVIAQKNMSTQSSTPSPVRQLTIEPGIGLHSNFGTDFLIANLIQWNPNKRLSLASHTSYNINNPAQRKFNGIKTNHDYSINQKFGVGTSFYSKRSSNTFMLMAGFKYTSFQETLINPDGNQVTASINSLSPDYGMMYSLKKGVKKYFFSFRVYVPIYPWPVKDVEIHASDGNMNNIALEFGIGIKIK